MAINIWTSLLKSEAKTEIYIPPEVSLNVSLDDFFKAFKRKITENRINADVTIDDVHWDDTDIVQKRIVVQYKGGDASNTNNIQQFLIGLDSVGNFTYIEEKIFLSRPELPKYPKSKVGIPSKPYVSEPYVKEPTVEKPRAMPMVIGVITGLISLMVIFAYVTQNATPITGMILLGVAVILIGRYAIKKINYNKDQNAFHNAFLNAANKYKDKLAKAESDYQRALTNANKVNSEANAEQKAWDKAWSDWNNNVLKTAYLSTTNDIFGRFTRALSSSVKLTIKELFEDKKAELKDRQEKEYNEEHIESLIREKKAKIIGSYEKSSTKSTNFSSKGKQMDDLFEMIKNLIAEKWEVDEGKITMGTSFSLDLGIDDPDLCELLIAELIETIEQEMGITIPEEKANDFKTVRDAYEYIKSQQE